MICVHLGKTPIETVRLMEGKKQTSNLFKITYPQVAQAISRLSVRLYCGHMVNAAYYSKVNQGLR